MNNGHASGNFEIKYYDKRVPEEENPVTVPVEIQEKYEKLDSFFERIFDENSLHVAKVIENYTFGISKLNVFFELKLKTFTLRLAIVQRRKG